MYAQNLTRQQIKTRMHEEKNKLKAMQDMVKEKRNDLTQVLQFSKVQDMENRLFELKKK